MDMTPFRRLRPFAAPLAGYAVLWAVMTYPQILSWRLVGDLGDPLGKMWQLGWVAHAVLHEPGRLFDGNVFYPAATTLAYSDTMLVPSMAAAPLVWLGLPLPLVFNVLMASGFILSGLAMFLLVRRLTHTPVAAWVAGLAFAFLPYRFSHYPHLELQFTMWMPLALWALHRTIEQGRWRDGLLTGLCVGLQLLSSMYYGVFFAVVLVPIGLILLASSPRRWRAAAALAAGAALAITLAVPVIRAHSAARQQVGERHRSDVLHYSAWLSDYLRPNAGNRTYPGLADWDGERERRVFPGFLLAGLAVLGVWPLRHATRLAYVAGAALAIEASRGLHGTVYRILWDHVAPLGGFRVPARFGLVAAVVLAVLAGWGVVLLTQRVRNARARLALAAALSFVILLEARTFPLPLAAIGRRTPQVYAWLAAQPRLAALELPVDEHPDFGYMYQAATHLQPIANGQSGFFPPWYDDLKRAAATFPSDESVAFLRRLGLTHVIVHRRLLGEERYDDLTHRAAGRRDISLVKTFSQRPESDVYRLLP